jgi:hypothetical protein
LPTHLAQGGPSTADGGPGSLFLTLAAGFESAKGIEKLAGVAVDHGGVLSRAASNRGNAAKVEWAIRRQHPRTLTPGENVILLL